MLATSTMKIERDRWFAGTLMRIVADSSDTTGALTVLEQRARRGFSPPLHIHHREDTALLVLDGVLTVSISDTETVVTSGGFAWLPRERPHTFRVDSDDAHFLEFALPGGVEGFHMDASDQAASVELPVDTAVDVQRLLAAAPSFEIDIIGPPMHPK